MGSELDIRVLNLIDNNPFPLKEIVIAEDLTVLSKSSDILDQLKPAFNQQTNKLDLNEACKILQSDSSLAVLETVNKTISQEMIQVQQMSEILLEELENLINIDLMPITQRQLQEIIDNIFINLKQQTDNNWLKYYTDDEYIAYHYNLAFVIQNKETGWLFYLLPISLSVLVNLELDSLFSLNLETRVNYDLKFEALKICSPIIALSFNDVIS